jgi:hypothetical protein
MGRSHSGANEKEFKHFGMDLEFLVRQKPKWRVALQDILFKEGDIVAHDEEAEEDEQQEGKVDVCYLREEPISG